MIILRMGMPQLRSLPINSPNQAPNHRPRRLLDLREPKIGNLRLALRCDEDVGGLAVPVDDGGLAHVQVLEAAGDVEHDAELEGVR